MPTLHEAKDWTLGGLRRLVSHLLPGSPEDGTPEPSSPGGDSGKPIVSPRCAEPKGYPRRSGRKYIERHGKGYRIRFWRRGRVIYLGCYNSLLAAVRDRNKALRAWDMEIPD